jgi:hypothetical protein
MRQAAFGTVPNQPYATPPVGGQLQPPPVSVAPSAQAQRPATHTNRSYKKRSRMASRQESAQAKELSKARQRLAGAGSQVEPIPIHPTIPPAPPIALTPPATPGTQGTPATASRWPRWLETPYSMLASLLSAPSR